MFCTVSLEQASVAASGNLDGHTRSIVAGLELDCGVGLVDGLLDDPDSDTSAVFQGSLFTRFEYRQFVAGNARVVVTDSNDRGVGFLFAQNFDHWIGGIVVFGGIFDNSLGSVSKLNNVCLNCACLTLSWLTKYYSDISSDHHYCRERYFWVLLHGFANLDGRAMSKSSGHVHRPPEVVDQHGRDGVRGHLLHNPTKDANLDSEMSGVDTLADKPDVVWNVYMDMDDCTPKRALRQPLTSGQCSTTGCSHRAKHAPTKSSHRPTALTTVSVDDADVAVGVRQAD